MEKVNLIIVATINPSEKEALGHYLEQMGVLYQQAGAKPVGKYKISETYIGNGSANLVSIMEFPSFEALNRVFKSEEYKTLLPYREKAFVSVEAYVSKE